VRTKQKLDQFEDKEVGSTESFKAVNGCNIGVIERSEQFGFTLESCDTIRVFGELFGQHLDRHIAAEPVILRLINLPHAALAQLVRDFVMRECFADHGHEVPPARLTAMLSGDSRADYRPLKRMSKGKSESAIGAPAKINIILNWFEELKQRAPAK